MSIAAATTRVRWRNQSALPGFGLTFGFTFFYLSLIVLIPIAALVIRPWEIGWSGFRTVLADDRVQHALQLSFGASLIAVVINTVFGLIIAWVLVRYRFPGRRVLDAL